MGDLTAALWWPGKLVRAEELMRRAVQIAERINPNSAQHVNCLVRLAEIILKDGQPLTSYKLQYIVPPFSKWRHNMDLRCVLLSDPSTFGAGGVPTKTPSRIQHKEV